MYGFKRNGSGVTLGYDSFSEEVTINIICNLIQVRAEITADPKQYGFSRLEIPQGFSLAKLTKELYWQTRGAYPYYFFRVSDNWNENAPVLMSMGLLERFNDYGVKLPLVSFVLEHLLIAGAQDAAMRLQGVPLEKIDSHLGVEVSNYSASFNGHHL